jgi:hypothetical protein
MPTPTPPTPYRSRLARFASFVAIHLLVVGAGIVVVSSGCSRREGADGAEQGDGGQTAVRAFNASRPNAADARPPPDARAEAERFAIADAGRFCGEKDLPDCPLQLWMKQNASTMLGFGEITTLAEVFDEIAGLAPPQLGPAYDFPNWESISKDGASAARIGNLTAAKASCRGCHSQYLRRYHAAFRGLPVHTLPRDSDP